MPAGRQWPVQTAAVGPVTVGTALWRLEGQLMVTAVVKVVLAFAFDGDMTIAETAPIRTADEHDGGRPMSSLVGARETAPQLQRVDVLLTGSAYAAPGQSETSVRLALISREDGVVLDKALRVRGDPRADGAPAPFERMKLGYERAYGGIGYPDNPLGTGCGSTRKPPNIVYPDGDPARPAGFGPIPASFPARKKLLGSLSKGAVSGRIAELPLSFDWRYFQAAPEDQRLNVLRGSEWIELEGFFRSPSSMRMRLPDVRGVARVYGAERAGVPEAVPLTADMLHIDTETQRCALICRGSFPVADEDVLDRFVVAGGVELPDEPMLWPATEEDLFEITSFTEGPTEQLRAIDVETFTGTRVMAPREHDASRGTFDGTLALDPADPSGEHPLTATRSLDFDGPPSAGSPFDLASPGSSPAPPPDALPGAPWDKSDVARPVPIPAGLKHTVPAGGAAELLEARRAAEDKIRLAREQAAAKARKDARDRARAEAEGKARQEAEARRREEAERFEREQQEARREQERRAAEQEKQKREAAKQLRSDMYGAFKRKRDS